MSDRDTVDKLPPHDEDFEGKCSLLTALDGIIKQLEDFKKRAGHINKLEFEDSMFHMKLDIRLDEK